jgi:spore coat protein U-like protein
LGPGRHGLSGETNDLALGSTGSASVTLTVYARVLTNQQTASSLTYTWSAPSPGIKYGTKGTAACPTGQPAGGTSTWTATVPSNCLVSATRINFGSAGIIASNVDATGTTTVQCTNTTPYTVGLNGGNSGAANPTPRKMANAAQTITYGRYQDSARSNPWGNTVGTNTESGTGTGANQALISIGPGWRANHAIARQLIGFGRRHRDLLIALHTCNGVLVCKLTSLSPSSCNLADRRFALVTQVYKSRLQARYFFCSSLRVSAVLLHVGRARFCGCGRSR